MDAAIESHPWIVGARARNTSLDAGAPPDILKEIPGSRHRRTRSLQCPAEAKTEFNAAAGNVLAAMKDIERLPVIPREIQESKLAPSARSWLPSLIVRPLQNSGKSVVPSPIKSRHQLT